MLGLFKQLADFVRFDDIRIDTNTFRLHYKATVLIFITASLLVTSGQYIGDPIDCIVEGVPGGLMDTYCWIHSTFSIPTRWTGKVGVDMPHPGISPHADLEEGQEVKYHKYYQWVAFVLFLQAALFYLPRYLWDSSEGGKIAMLIQDLQNPMIASDDKKEQIGVIVRYFGDNRGAHVLYALRFFGCEVLNFINVIAQIYFTDFFLGGTFSTYGTDVLAYTNEEAEDRPDPMKVVFPKVTKCTFHKYGPSGTVEKKDGLCVLPLNIINEKIYIFIWFWLVFLAVVTGLVLLYRFAMILGAQIRVAIIATKGTKKTHRLAVEEIVEPTAPLKRTNQPPNFLEKLGDWLVLYFLTRNLNALVVNDLITALHKDEQGRQQYNNTETLKLKPETTPV